MSKLMKKLLICGTLLAIAGGSAALYANKVHDQKELDGAELVQASSLTMDQAIKTALAEMPGSVIEAELEQDDDVIKWEIELVNNNNEVYEFEIDAKTGAILKTEQDKH